jgi:hypothetical protein
MKSKLVLAAFVLALSLSSQAALAQSPSRMTPKIAAAYLGLAVALQFSGACHFKVNMPYLLQLTSVEGLDQGEVDRMTNNDLEELKTHPEGMCKAAYTMLDVVGAIIY